MQVLNSPLQAKDLMVHDVLSAQSDWPVRRLAEFFTQHGISGAPVVDATDRLVGVVSVTDVVRHASLPQREPRRYGVPTFYQSGLDDLYAPEEQSGFDIQGGDDVFVQDIMTPVVYAVTPSAPLSQVADTMVRGRIHRVFVTDQGRVLGILTALDVLRALT